MPPRGTDLQRPPLRNLNRRRHVIAQRPPFFHLSFSLPAQRKAPPANPHVLPPGRPSRHAAVSRSLPRVHTGGPARRLSPAPRLYKGAHHEPRPFRRPPPPPPPPPPFPPPLKTNRDSRSIKKPSPSSSSSSSSSTTAAAAAAPLLASASAPPPASAAAPRPSQQQQQRHPVIIYTHSPKIIHTQPRDFMALVQKLTGLSRSSPDDDPKPPRPPPPHPPAEAFANSGDEAEAKTSKGGGGGGRTTSARP
ncbi:hypothetical protein NL676_029317 [Syzygium grande]|nr:hypothetical protein NL676_029317 [Syzygium grande]